MLLSFGEDCGAFIELNRLGDTEIFLSVWVSGPVNICWGDLDIGPLNESFTKNKI